MPAAAVIPAPLAYIKVVAVKKLVVEVLVGLLVAVYSTLPPGFGAVQPNKSTVSSLNRVRSRVL